MSNLCTIYYNPKCGSCRTALQFLKEKGFEPRVVEYLKNPPSLSELKELAEKLGPQWNEMIRTKEPIFNELNLGKEGISQATLLKAIVDHPILLQRPLIVCGNRALVARPPVKVKDFF